MLPAEVPANGDACGNAMRPPTDDADAWRLDFAGCWTSSSHVRSWVEAAAVLPIKVIQVYPEAWHVRNAALPNTRFRTTTDMNALADADVVITDCWPEDAHAEDLLPFQVTAVLLDRLKPEAAFIPCPPVRRGQEVSEDAMTASRCRVTEAKAFLLHGQNALLEWILAEPSVGVRD